MRVLFTVLVLTFVQSISGQSIGLRIIDNQTREILPFATIVVNKQSFITPETGTLWLQKHQFQKVDSFTVSYIGYQKTKFPAHIIKNNQINILNILPAKDLPVIEVSTPRSVFNGSIGTISLKVSRLRSIPQLGGQSDLLKALQILPGISGGLEGTSGLNIRGGNDSHTHLIIDGNSVYNANHIGGFLSSLPDFGVKQVTVHKGGVSSRFGGRLAGVVDLQLRDGRLNGHYHEFGIGTGLISLGSEGGITKNISYLLTGRIAYPTLINQFLERKNHTRNSSGNFESFNLRDGIAKVTLKEEKTKIALSFFGSGDSGYSQFEDNNFFSYEDFNWGTNNIAFNGLHELSSAMFLQGNIGYTSYTYQLFNREVIKKDGESQSEKSSNIEAKLADLKGDLRFNYDPYPFINLQSGLEVVQHNFTFDGSQSINGAIPVDTLLSGQRAIRYGAYIQVRANPGKLSLDLGLRKSGMLDTPFDNFEPRVKLGVQVSKGWFLNTGYDKQVQYVHRLRADQTIFPNEFWQLATTDRPPATSQQFHLGGAYDLKKIGLFVGVEAYYRMFENLTESNPLLVGNNQGIENLINQVALAGKGESKGIEAYLEWKKGKYDLQFSYTLSKSERTFPDLNNGDPFPFTFDRTHDLSLNVSYQLPKSWKLNGSFIYQSGRAVTAPTRVTLYYNIYDRINNARFPPFHILNMSIEKDWQGKKHSSTHHYITFSTYNSYNRENPYFVALTPVVVRGPDPNQPPEFGIETELSRSIELRTRSLFPFIPGISYRRTFSSSKELKTTTAP